VTFCSEGKVLADVPESKVQRGISAPGNGGNYREIDFDLHQSSRTARLVK
jgi:hypothetical protein